MATFDLEDSSAIANLPSNQRTAVRYVRDDIIVYLSHKPFLRRAQTIAVKLQDITSRGALVLTTEKLTVNAKIRLILHFRDGKHFTIAAKIVRHAAAPAAKHEYGIQFDRYHNELGDHLLATQKQLVFK